MIRLIKYLFRMDENMRHTFRRRRHTSNWVYTIVTICILLVTLCIISLIPGSSGSSPDNADPTPSPGLTGDTVGSENPEQNSPGTSDSSSTGQENNGISPADSYISITINKAKLSALQEAYQAGVSAQPSQNLEQLHLQLQELALAREQLTAEREEFRKLYESASETLSTEKNDYLQKQTDLETERERLKQELDKAEAQLSEYDDKLSTLDTERKKLSEEENELQQTEVQLQHLNEDITHAREQLTTERRELESGIQSIKENPNLSSESKETALVPLYAALEQLLMREAQLEHSEAEYAERSEALLAGKENLASRLQSHEEERSKLDETLAPHKQAQQELTSALKAAEAQLLPISAELERIGTEESAIGKEYQDKLTALDVEEERIAQEEQTLKKQLASQQVPPSDNLGDTNSLDANTSSTDNSMDHAGSDQINSEQNIQDTNTQDVHILAQRTLERIFILLQDVSLSENSNIASDILLTDIADITLTTPESFGENQNVSRIPSDSSEADSSGSRKHNN